MAASPDAVGRVDFNVEPDLQPIYPTPSRYWQVVQKHKLTQFYSAPTAIRLLRRLGEEHVKGYDLSSLRILGSVGEPINPEAWTWYNTHVGKGECSVVDTFWSVAGSRDPARITC